MVATFHFALPGTQDQISKSWSRKYYTKLLSATRLCCSIAFIEWFLFWVISVTYNIGIYICVYVYKVSYIHPFFVIFNCSVFSALHAKHFEIWKKHFLKLMNWMLHSTIHQVVWYFWVFVINPFSLLCSIFFPKKTVFRLVSLSLANDEFSLNFILFL